MPGLLVTSVIFRYCQQNTGSQGPSNNLRILFVQRPSGHDIGCSLSRSSVLCPTGIPSDWQKEIPEFVWNRRSVKVHLAINCCRCRRTKRLLHYQFIWCSALYPSGNQWESGRFLLHLSCTSVYPHALLLCWWISYPWRSQSYWDAEVGKLLQRSENPKFIG